MGPPPHASAARQAQVWQGRHAPGHVRPSSKPFASSPPPSGQVQAPGTRCSLGSVGFARRGEGGRRTPRAGALPAAEPHSQAARPGSPATHPSPLLSEGRTQTRPFLSSGRDGLVPASCTHASHGGHTDSPRDRAAQTSGSGRFAPRPPRTRQRLSTWDHLPTHAPTRIYRTGNENQEKL